MIYKNSYFRKELRQAYIENKISTSRKLAFALFLGMLAFAVHFVLQSLSESVLSDAIPQVMQPSYFSTVSIYVTISFFINILYFMIYYEYLSFAEIRRNRWYLLEKMGYMPLRMIFSKLFAYIFSLISIYSTGFVFTIILTVFLKYTFVYKYLPALFIKGLIDLIVVGIVFMTASIFIMNPGNARYFMLLFTAATVIIRFATGYTRLTSDRILMQDVGNMFDLGKTVYIPISAAIILICFIICVYKARNVARFYSLPSGAYKKLVPEDSAVMMMDRSGKLSPFGKGEINRGKIIEVVTSVLFVLFVLSALAVNIFIILISTSQPGREVTIKGVIPYIFKSDTMEPTIMINDLAYFRRVDQTESIKTGDIILFQDKKVVYVERVLSQSGGELSVDIDFYPPLTQVGSMKKTVGRKSVYGVYTHSNRWLGALILFANTIFGRLLFLLIPAFVLFFYKPIINFFEENKTFEDEE
ncbi:MAG: S26 family signal peptidase [Bacillota bacterium]|nr:S26 family signal peptidase [Bacillota bacterium]